MELHDYQNKIIDKLMTMPRAGLFLGMGLGKTAIILTTLSRYIKENPDLKFLILAPPRLVDISYDIEIEKFAPDLKYVKMPFNYEKQSPNVVQRDKYMARVRSGEIEHNVFILSYTILSWFLKNKYHLPYRGLVIDESSRFKSYRSTNLKMLKRELSNFDYRYIMTGTPIPNGYLDYWAQIYILDDGESLGKNYFHYRKHYFRTSPWNPYNHELVPGNDDIIKDKTKHLVISMSTEGSGLVLPDILYSIVTDNMPRQVREQYTQFKKDFIIKYREQTPPEPTDITQQTQESQPKLGRPFSKSTDKYIIAKTRVDLTNKLLQFSSGAVYTDQNEHDFTILHDVKMILLREVLNNNPGRILLAYNFRHEATRLKDYFPSDITFYDNTSHIISAWEAGHTHRVLATYPSSIGHGLNLQSQCHTIVWFGFTWSLELYNQFNKRVHRQGQANTVKIIHLAVGDIEYRLLDKLKSKDITQQALLDYMEAQLTK